MEQKTDLGDIEKELIKQLELQLENVKDETSIEEIRRLVKELEELSPSNDYILNKSDLKFKKDFYRDALEAKKFIKTIDEKEKFKKIYATKFKVATLLILISLGLSSVVAIGGLGFFKPDLEFKEETIEKSFNILDNKKYKSYEEIEKEFGTKILKPKKLPKGYELSGFDFSDSEIFSKFIISYQRNKETTNEISYTIRIQKSMPTSYKERIQVSPDYRKEYFHENIKFDIFKNIDIYGCIFEYINVSYTLAGFENEGDVIEFIDSLKKD